MSASSEFGYEGADWDFTFDNTWQTKAAETGLPVLVQRDNTRRSLSDADSKIF